MFFLNNTYTNIYKIIKIIHLDNCCTYCNSKYNNNNKNTILHLCTGCRSVLYCNKNCQGKDWLDHKYICNYSQQQKQQQIGLDIDITINEEINKHFWLNKYPVLPTFLITYGPPGSGKGTVINNIINNDRFRIRKNEMIDIDVDVIIKLLPNYNSKRKNIIKTVTKEGMKNKKLSELYNTYRKKADIISLNLLNESLLKRFSIRFETTGNVPWWIQHEIERIKRMQYRIWLVYPFVPLKELQDRVKKRQAVQQGARNLESFVKNAKKNILKIIPSLDKFIIYDNSGALGKEKLLFELDGSFNKVYSCPVCLSRDDEKTKKLLGKTLYHELLKLCESCHK